MKKNTAGFWLATWNIKINAITNTKVFREPPDGCFKLRFFSPSIWIKQETWRTQSEGLDPPLIGGHAGELLTDLSKVFDCIDHELLIAKLHAYGFDTDALKFIYSYLKGRKQRTKINSSYSSFAEILFGVPQGSIPGPLIFKP